MFPSPFFFFNDTATTEIYTLSLHDALPICNGDRVGEGALAELADGAVELPQRPAHAQGQHEHRDHRERQERRSEEHTSELQSQSNIVCRPLLETTNSEVTATR